jgi:hypothetical protein
LDTQATSDTITFSQVANLTYALTVNQTIAFVSLGGRAYELTASNNLGISDAQFEFNYVDDRKPVEQVLGITDDVQTLSTIEVAQAIAFAQTVNASYPQKLYVSHFIAFQQNRLPQQHRVSASNTMALVGAMPNVPVTMHTSQTISFVQEIRGPNEPIITDTISFAQTAAGARGYDLTQNMTLVHTNFVQSDFVRLVEQDSGISQYLTYYEDTPCARKQYTPFQGEGATPPDNLAVASGSTTDRFSLYTPVLGVRSSEVILRAPEMDDRDRNAYNRVAGETRGGRIRVFADPIWPKVRTLAVTITGVTEANVTALQTFLDATLGQEVGITDWKGNLWRGTVMNPNDVASQDGRAKWTVSLEIEAEPVDTVIPENSDGDGQSVTFGQTVSVEVV